MNDKKNKQSVCPKCGSPLRKWFVSQEYVGEVCTNQNCEYEKKV